MRTFVVNLARRPDRRRRMEQILPAGWEVEFTTEWPEPMDGARITTADLDGYHMFPWQIESTNRWWNRPLTLGEIGCAISHLSCWRRASRLGSGPVLILEDDIELVPDIDRALVDGLRRLHAVDPGWHLAYLGRWALDPAADTPVGNGLVRPAYSYCTFAYLLSEAGLAELLESGFDQDLLPVDELLPALYMPHPRKDVRDRYPPRLRAYAFEPPLVTQLPKEVAGSDTESSEFLA